MNFAVIATAVLATTILLLGIVMQFRTRLFNDLAKYLINPWGIWLAAVIRVFAAVVLWFAAPSSRYPGLFKVFAVVALVAGVGVILVGHHRVRKIVNWSVSRPPWVLRCFALIAIAVGGFILWALI